MAIVPLILLGKEFPFSQCFSAVEKLLMACCTGGMSEGAALPRGDTEDTEVSSILIRRL